MRKGIELQEADGHPLANSGNALRAESRSLKAKYSLGKTICFTSVPTRMKAI